MSMVSSNGVCRSCVVVMVLVVRDRRLGISNELVLLLWLSSCVPFLQDDVGLKNCVVLNEQVCVVNLFSVWSFDCREVCPSELCAKVVGVGFDFHDCVLIVFVCECFHVLILSTTCQDAQVISQTLIQQGFPDLEKKHLLLLTSAD